MKKSCVATVALACLISGQAMAESISVNPFLASTVRPDGPRQFEGALSQFFFNVEGADNGDFANYGVLRFDLGTLLAGATINSVGLDLFESNASFTINGNVAVYYSDQDGVDVSTNDDGTAEAAYFVNGNAPFANDFTDTVFLGGDFFEETANGAQESFNLSQGLQSFADDDSIITLVFAEFNDSGVAATYGGIGNPNGEPLLTIEYTPAPVPLPPAVWLLGSGLLGLLGWRRRTA